jgi:hypothetical protein
MTHVALVKNCINVDKIHHIETADFVALFVNGNYISYDEATGLTGDFERSAYRLAKSLGTTVTEIVFSTQESVYTWDEVQNDLQLGGHLPLGISPQTCQKDALKYAVMAMDAAYIRSRRKMPIISPIHAELAREVTGDICRNGGYGDDVDSEVDRLLSGNILESDWAKISSGVMKLQFEPEYSFSG